MKIVKSFAVALIGAGLSVSAFAQSINVWLEPETQVVNPGDLVSIGVYVNANGGTALALSDAYLSFTWDPAVLTNSTPNTRIEPAPWDQSYWAPGAPVNSDLQDGDARRELLGALPTLNPVAPAGVMRDPTNRLLATTLEFTVGSISAPTAIRLWDVNNGASTNFFRGNFAIGQWNLVFEDGTYSEAILNPVPEPMTLSLLGLGALAMLRRKKGRGNKA
ncbi:MAG: PEP-CTERM sorting domain-containing protein [Fimbriimonadaceae bacterium]|nr:PEP-CTERM sorting domain-containing protein [Fimbriimonadaceae bacterium]